MKNIIITLDEKTAAKARAYAARHGKSLSRLIGDLLHRAMLQSKEYRYAMYRYLAKTPARLNKGGAAYFSREKLYDRPVQRSAGRST